MVMYICCWYLVCFY